MKNLLERLRFTIVLTSLLLLGSISSCTDDNAINTPNNDDYDAIAIEGQEDFSEQMGCLLSPVEEYKKVSIAKTPQLKSIPESRYLNCPPVGNQGHNGSCVGWATAYAARSIMTNVNYLFSPSYVYNQTKLRGCSNGTYPVRALRLMAYQGVCTLQTMPYVQDDCYRQPNYEQRLEASRFRINSFYRVHINVESIRKHIAAGRPVVVAGLVDAYFKYLPSNRVLSNVSGKGGGHCYCVVGYSNKFGCFKVLNSWGEQWSSNGYAWVSYDIIDRLWSEAYVMY